MMDYPNPTNCYYSSHVAELSQSFKRLLGRELITVIGTPGDFAKAVFHAPIAVLSHDNTADPLFNYANLQALTIFGYDWQELIGQPSRLSAQPANQHEREQSLLKVANHGFIDHYQGIRITKNGKTFKIKNAVVWTITDGQGQFKGQAACFSEWEFL